MSDIDLDAIRARCEAATEGPWHWRNTPTPYLLGAHSRVVMAFKRWGMQGAQPEFRDDDGTLHGVEKRNINDFPDANFIAHARTDVPALLAEVERLRAEAPSCDGGCNNNSGPEETCSLHGYRVPELLGMLQAAEDERDEMQAEVERHRRALATGGTDD